jgi:hypothetical protein
MNVILPRYDGRVPCPHGCDIDTEHDDPVVRWLHMGGEPVPTQDQFATAANERAAEYGEWDAFRWLAGLLVGATQSALIRGEANTELLAERDALKQKLREANSATVMWFEACSAAQCQQMIAERRVRDRDDKITELALEWKRVEVVFKAAQAVAAAESPEDLQEALVELRARLADAVDEDVEIVEKT